MSIQDEYRLLKMRCNGLLEQNEKLQGTIRSLESDNEALHEKKDFLLKERDSFKNAFEKMFLHNISNSWEKVPESNRKSMSLDDKVNFFKHELNQSKIGLRIIYEEKIERLESSLDMLRKEYDEYKEIQKKRISTDDIPKKTTNDVNEKSIRTNDGKSSINIFNMLEQERDNKKIDTSSKIKDVKSSILKNDTDSGADVSQTDLKKTAQSLASQISADINKEKENVDIEEIDTLQTYNPNELQRLDYMSKFEILEPEEKIKIRDIVSNYANGDKALSSSEIAIINIIAETGYYKLTTISNEVKRRYPNTDLCNEINSKLYVIKNFLEKENFIECGEKISLGLGRPIQPVLLTDLGFWFYLLTNQKNPVQSQLKTASKNQKSTSHGSQILELVQILSSAGYSCEQENALKTNDGKQSICDILAKRSGNSYRIEYEKGNYPEEGYFKKFKNILDVTNFLIFVTYSSDKKNKLESLFKDYIYNQYGLDLFKKQHKKYLFCTITEVKKDPDIFHKYSLKESEDF